MDALAPGRQTTASQAPIIICGTDAERNQLYLERSGQVVNRDLTDIFAVQWGKHNEPFVIDWIEKSQHVVISERQRWVQHPTLPKISATQDGFVVDWDAVVEIKVLSPYTPAKEFFDYYAPQVATQMACRGCTRGFLMVQQGNSPPQPFELHADASYIDGVLEQLLAFQACVDERRMPGPVPPPPVPPEQWRTVDLDADTQVNWGPPMAAHLNHWRKTYAVAKEHEQSKADVKALLPPDVGRVTCGKLLVRRARNGSVTISEAA